MDIPGILGSTDAGFNHRMLPSLSGFHQFTDQLACVNSTFVVTRDMRGVNSIFVFALDDTFDPIMHYLSDMRDAHVRLNSVLRASPPATAMEAFTIHRRGNASMILVLKQSMTRLCRKNTASQNIVSCS